MNRLDDKAGAKMCMDLANFNNTIQVINFSCNSLGHMVKINFVLYERIVLREAIRAFASE